MHLVWLLFAPAALATPDDVTLSGMTEHGGERVVADLSGDYRALVRELGIVVANKPLAPAETLGAYGFDLSFANTFAFITVENDDGTPTPWQRAVEDEDPGSYLFVPQVSARKGLPMSFEVGMSAGWLGLTRQGTFSGWGRLGVVEGYKPWPDLSVHAGYAGYVGNDELELGVMDLGVTLGSTFPFGSFPGINNAQFSPYIDYTTLRISAHPLLDEQTAAAVGAVPIASGDSEEGAIVVPQIGGGFQVTNGTVLFRLIGTWSPNSLATATIGMGFTY